MNKIIKCLIRFLLEVIIATFLMIGVKILIDGMWLLGLPDLNDIQSVSISYPNLTDEVKEVSNNNDKELALKLTGFLKYDLFEQTDNEEEPIITITYHLRNGLDKTISANNNTVWWNGKVYSIKDKEIFINLAEGIFFPDDLQTK